MHLNVLKGLAAMAAVAVMAAVSDGTDGCDGGGPGDRSGAAVGRPDDVRRRTGRCSRPTRRGRRSSRSTSARRPTAARRARPTSRRSTRRLRRCSAPRPASIAVTDLVIHPEDAQRLHLGDARHGRRREAGAAPRRRRRQDRADRDREAGLHQGGAVERAGRRRRPPQPAHRLGHRHGVRRAAS